MFRFGQHSREIIMKLILAKFVFFLHLSTIAFLVFGCLLPRNFLVVHMISIPIVILQWWLNADQCILTQIQYWLEGRTLVRGEGGTFVKTLFASMGLQPSRTQLIMIVYGFIILSGVVSGLRIWA